MSNIGKIFKLLHARDTTYKTTTMDILKLVETRLTLAFQTVFESKDRAITWTSVEDMDGSAKAVMVSGSMAMEIGETVMVGNNSVVIDANNITEYNKFVKFAFPIIMLEMASTEELIEHIQRISKIGSAVSMTPENLAKVLDKAADQYEESILNDPSKVAVVDTATKPDVVLGFSAETLTDDQIKRLMLYEKLDLGKTH